MDNHRKARDVPTEETRNPNISTENQPEGSARRPSDTLDREPKRDPLSGGSIPENYNPESGTRVGEEKETRAGREKVIEKIRDDEAGERDDDRSKPR